MQTVVRNYIATNLDIQTASRLYGVHNGFPNNLPFAVDYKFEEDLSQISSEANEHIQVDEDDKEDELIIADDIFPDNQPEAQIHHIDQTAERPLEVNQEEVSSIQNFEPVVNNPEELTTQIPRGRVWHPHVYNSSDKMPTPHTIENILGLLNPYDDKAKENKEEPPQATVSQIIQTTRNYSNRRPSMYKEKATQVPTDLTDRQHNMNLQKHRLQEQLLQRTARAVETGIYGGGLQYFTCEDQPLNLTMPKAKGSRGCSRDNDKTAKGKWSRLTM